MNESSIAELHRRTRLAATAVLLRDWLRDRLDQLHTAQVSALVIGDDERIALDLPARSGGHERMLLVIDIDANDDTALLDSRLASALDLRESASRSPIDWALTREWRHYDLPAEATAVGWGSGDPATFELEIRLWPA